MKSDENVLGKGIEAIFAKTAHLRKGGEKQLELPNGMITREGEELIIRLNLGGDEDIRGAVEELAEAASSGMLDQLIDPERLKQSLKEHLELAEMAMEDGDLDAAVDEYKLAIKINDAAAIRYNLAVLYEKMNKPKVALKQYRKVISADPRHVAALNNAGRIYYAQGDFDRAMSLYQKVIQLDPSLIGKGKSKDLFAPRFSFRKFTE